MKSKQEQIEEIVCKVKNAIGNNGTYRSYFDYIEMGGNDVDHAAEESAEEIYKAGYRKASDVIELLGEDKKKELEIKKLRREIELLKAENASLREKVFVSERAFSNLVHEMYENGIRPVCDEKFFIESRLKDAEKELAEEGKDESISCL